jgi:hypothetical protein
MLGRGSLADAPALINRISQYTRRAASADSWSQGLFRVEVLSNLARETAQWNTAEDLASLLLEVDPHYGGSHYAKALVAEHRGDRTTAAQEFEAAKGYWSHAEVDFPPLKVIQKTSSSPKVDAPKAE